MLRSEQCRRGASADLQLSGRGVAADYDAACVCVLLFYRWKNLLAATRALADRGLQQNADFCSCKSLVNSIRWRDIPGRNLFTDASCHKSRQYCLSGKELFHLCQVGLELIRVSVQVTPTTKLIHGNL
jgi:hypothetical protein